MTSAQASLRASTGPAAGEVLRTWRRRRRMSQLELALDAGISTRHLSFVETGRATASREMLIRLAEHLDMPLRERNLLLAAGGYAPIYPERPLTSPDMTAARAAVDRILKAQEPFPALAVDRHWSLLRANAAIQPLLAGVHQDLLTEPVNVLRLSLHPDGLAPRIANLPEWRAHLLERLRQQIDRSSDPVLMQLLAELSNYPVAAERGLNPPFDAIAIPLQLRVPDGPLLSLISTTTIFGTPVDVTLSELALESFYPADEPTRVALTEIAGKREQRGEE